MPDDKSKRGKADRSRIAAGEKYEVADMAKKTGMPAPLVEKIAKEYGPSRAAVEAKLREMKENAQKK